MHDTEAPARGGETPHSVELLRFDSRGALARAFSRLVACRDVGSCVIDPDALRLRFVAPRPVADVLITALYEEGGLLWCSRHRIAGPRARCGVMRDVAAPETPPGPRAPH